MSLEPLPEITKDELEAADHDALKYLFLFADKYTKHISASPDGAIQQQMTLEQNVLLAFVDMDNQISNGGFIQLIENGYGKFVFDTPLSAILNDWGAIKTAYILDRARVIYHHKRDILEREKTLEEFAKLYQEHPDFEDLEKEYYAVIDSERFIIKRYIETHIASFAKIV